MLESTPEASNKYYRLLDSGSPAACGRRCRSWNRVPGKNLSPRRRTTTTTYDGQKITPLIVGAQFWFWSFFIDFELMSNFFVVQEKDSRQIVCFSGWSLISRDSEISSFESYTLLRPIENENQLDVGIQFFVAWVWFLCSKRIISFFTSIGPQSRTSQF